MLATSPQTAHFISLKLAQRFVSDEPPAALVDRLAKTFQKKKGDIREVLSTLFHSPEFWAEGTYRAKVKTPLEFVASAVRAAGASVDDALPLVRQLNNMGMPLYGAQPPTGYSMKADTWVSSSALLNRMNFALALTSGKVRGVKIDAGELAGGPPAPADLTLALATMVPPHGAILCHQDAHIAVHECGAPEFFTHGARLVTIAGTNGKLTPESISAALNPGDCAAPRRPRRRDGCVGTDR